MGDYVRGLTAMAVASVFFALAFLAWSMPIVIVATIVALVLQAMGVL